MRLEKGAAGGVLPRAKIDEVARSVVRNWGYYPDTALNQPLPLTMKLKTLLIVGVLSGAFSAFPRSNLGDSPVGRFSPSLDFGDLFFVHGKHG